MSEPVPHRNELLKMLEKRRARLDDEDGDRDKLLLFNATIYNMTQIDATLEHANGNGKVLALMKKTLEDVQQVIESQTRVQYLEARQPGSREEIMETVKRLNHGRETEILKLKQRHWILRHITIEACSAFLLLLYILAQWFGFSIPGS